MEISPVLADAIGLRRENAPQNKFLLRIGWGEGGQRSDEVRRPRRGPGWGDESNPPINSLLLLIALQQYSNCLEFGCCWPASQSCETEWSGAGFGKHRRKSNKHCIYLAVCASSFSVSYTIPNHTTAKWQAKTRASCLQLMIQLLDL